MNGFKQYLLKSKILTDYNYWKVITPSAAYDGTSGFANIFIGSPDEIHSRSYISFAVKTKEEAESLLCYLKCKLSHILLSTRKITHSISNKELLKWIPLVPLDRKWNNNALHEYLKLDTTLIELIKTTKIDGDYIR